MTLGSLMPDGTGLRRRPQLRISDLSPRPKQSYHNTLRFYNTATRADISNGAWQKPPSCLIIRVTLQQIQAWGFGHHATITGTVSNLRNSDRLIDPGFKGVYWPVQQSERTSLSSSTGSYTRPKENA